MQKQHYATHMPYRGENVTRKREATDEPACDHKNQRGFTYRSRCCPNCGFQLTYDVDEKPKDSDAQERARFNSLKNAALVHGRKNKQ